MPDFLLVHIDMSIFSLNTKQILFYASFYSSYRPPLPLVNSYPPAGEQK